MTHPEDLHPYDDKTRRFRHDDEDPSRRARALALIANWLGLSAPPPLAGLRYDLRFYSGGMGSFDSTFVAFPCSPAEVDAIVARLGLATPEAALADKEWHDDFEWLVLNEDEPRPLPEAVAAFVEENRTEFQPSPDERARVWFFRWSGVNEWSLVYEQEGELSFIGWSQG